MKLARNLTTSHRAYRYLSTSKLHAQNSQNEDLCKDLLKNSNLNFKGEIFKTWPKSRLFRNYINFKACQYDFLLNNAEKIMVLGYKFPPSRSIMKWFIYDQFVGGDTISEVKKTANDLKNYNIEPMLAIPMETENLTPDMDVNAWQEGNLLKMIDSLDKAGKVAGNHPPVVHLKVTGIMDNDLFLKISEFVGFDWADKENGNSEKFEKCVDELLNLMQGDENGANYYKDNLSLDENDLAHLKTVANRYKLLADATKSNNVECAIDAEYININPGIAVVTMAMARLVNQPNKAYIWNTYQCYLKNTKKIVDYEVEYLTKKHEIAWGAKLVRGAYIDKERLRAEEGNYPDPVNDTIEDTHKNYNTITYDLIKKMDHPAYQNKLKILVASHNTDTVKITYNLRKLCSTPENIIFGQLFGMCDHISCELGSKNVPIYKSMPIGGFEDVMPYLARRGIENKSVMRGSHEEALLLRKTLFKI